MRPLSIVESILAVLSAGTAVAADLPAVHVHTLRSERQSGETEIRVLLPRHMKEDRRYPVLYILPVEVGRGTRWGDGLGEVQNQNLADRFGLICAAPTFSQLPWYADHPTDPAIRQESYFLHEVVPLVDNLYPTLADAKGRLLLGFSKSGWGAFSLLLRHPDIFGKAVAWDAPLMMDRPGRYGSGPIFGTEENFARRQVSELLRQKASLFAKDLRLFHFGYGNFRDHHQRAHQWMDELGIRHVYHDGPQRQHAWNSGWLPEAVEMLMEGDGLDYHSTSPDNNR